MLLDPVTLIHELKSWAGKSKQLIWNRCLTYLALQIASHVSLIPCWFWFQDWLGLWKLKLWFMHIIIILLHSLHLACVIALLFYVRRENCLTDHVIIQILVRMGWCQVCFLTNCRCPSFAGLGPSVGLELKLLWHDVLIVGLQTWFISLLCHF